MFGRSLGLFLVRGSPDQRSHAASRPPEEALRGGRALDQPPGGKTPLSACPSAAHSAWIRPAHPGSPFYFITPVYKGVKSAGDNIHKLECDLKSAGNPYVIHSSIQRCITVTVYIMY